MEGTDAKDFCFDGPKARSDNARLLASVAPVRVGYGVSCAPGCSNGRRVIWRMGAHDPRAGGALASYRSVRPFDGRGMGICFLLWELMKPDRAKNNKYSIAFLIIMIGWIWIQDLARLRLRPTRHVASKKLDSSATCFGQSSTLVTLLDVLKECCSIG